MSRDWYETGPLPDHVPERRATPRDGDRVDAPWRHPVPPCECGKTAWVFPEPGKRFCGFCPASDEYRRRPR